MLNWFRKPPSKKPVAAPSVAPVDSLTILREDTDIAAERFRARYVRDENAEVRCVDGGKCHHGCKDNLTGCSRRTGCVPLTNSGFDDNWNPIITE